MKRILAFTLPLVTFAGTLPACPLCRARVAAGIYGPDFGVQLFFTLLPILVLGTIGFGFYYADHFGRENQSE